MPPSFVQTSALFFSYLCLLAPVAPLHTLTISYPRTSVQLSYTTAYKGRILFSFPLPLSELTTCLVSASFPSSATFKLVLTFVTLIGDNSTQTIRLSFLTHFPQF
ncbi:hypothetical protein BC939DRAFT_449147 [Gamsiella multidivaricata]|uniref:uncharacterized protein n=1 Tax=Gamsiella multidivaricata TaxID=101098 RepID=UPI0022204C52|nr:uncharacterized protein BC939DRAFT_449147 [Gamsiella multidivaricata]KAI7825249.1 hypothetical protein BC939DRAFT_449147 [Gamsiella multidivaricata]